jgi:hypothetical protein
MLGLQVALSFLYPSTKLHLRFTSLFGSLRKSQQFCSCTTPPAVTISDRLVAYESSTPPNRADAPRVLSDNVQKFSQHGVATAFIGALYPIPGEEYPQVSSKILRFVRLTAAEKKLQTRLTASWRLRRHQINDGLCMVDLAGGAERSRDRHIRWLIYATAPLYTMTMCPYMEAWINLTLHDNFPVSPL